jgi:hypothetical protein
MVALRTFSKFIFTSFRSVLLIRRVNSRFGFGEDTFTESTSLTNIFPLMFLMNMMLGFSTLVGFILRFKMERNTSTHQTELRPISKRIFPSKDEKLFQSFSLFFFGGKNDPSIVGRKLQLCEEDHKRINNVRACSLFNHLPIFFRRLFLHSIRFFL